jgi:hypothetical protein
MKKSISLYAFLFLAMSLWTNAVFGVPTITATTSQGTTIKFTATLSEKLLSGYKIKIDLNNGKGLVAMTCSGTTCTLSSNALPKVDTSIYKVGIYDAKGVLQGATTNGSYVIASTAEINTIPISTTGYTKISNSGTELPVTAKLGSDANDWSCTKDNKTGLTWEVKTDDGGLRDKDWYYSWYKPSGYNGGFAGYTDINVAFGAPNCSTQNNCNTDAFTNAVNTQGLCGKKDWRMPTIDELKGLLASRSTINQSLNDNLSIEVDYFPNTNDDYYWSSSPDAYGSRYAWYVYFNDFNGYSHGSNKSVNSFVRLVR